MLPIALAEFPRHDGPPHDQKHSISRPGSQNAELENHAENPGHRDQYAPQNPDLDNHDKARQARALHGLREDHSHAIENLQGPEYGQDHRARANHLALERDRTNGARPE